MKIRMTRHIREGLKNLIRNGWMTFASLSAMAITLLILGASLVIALNAQQLSSYVENQLTVSAYLDTNISDAQGQQVAAEVRTLPGVASVQFISKEQGFKDLQNNIGKQYNDVMESLSQSNPLPVQLVVKAKDPKQTLGVGQEIRALPGVSKVNDGKQFVDNLLNFLNVVRNIGLVFVVALLVTAMFLISNTIKITIFSRRREIEIMKLVGATNWFIRWPFLWEGISIGVFGALIPFAILVLGYQSLYNHAGGTFIAIAFQLLPAVTIAEKLAIVMFGLGIFIGMWGGLMSIRRFMRI